MSTLPIYVWILVLAVLAVATATASVMLSGGARGAGLRSARPRWSRWDSQSAALLNIVLARAGFYRLEAGKVPPLRAVTMAIAFAGRRRFVSTSCA
jgi:hypothetical protein